MLAVLHVTYLGSIFGSSTDDMDSDEVKATSPEILCPLLSVQVIIHICLKYFSFFRRTAWLATPFRNGCSSAGRATG